MGAMMSLPAAEFAALRQTITLRGTVRMALLPLILFGWALLGLLILLYGELPLAGLFPLAVLAGGFEAIHALHVGAERIGRYLQVYYESGTSGSPQWETTAMAVGPALPGGGIDPLFSVVFVLCAVVNLLPSMIPQPTQVELGFLVAIHGAFTLRVIRARGAAARQRAVELESFRAVQQQTSTR